MFGCSVILVVALGCGAVLSNPVHPAPYATVDEDALLTVPELIEKYGYPVEVHHVQSDDGYILELHRIPYGVAPGAGPQENKPVVFVQHGLLSSSADWVIAGPQKGIAYLLADLGYDVWMGNTRGNTYSRRHVKLSPRKAAFWDYSWHEIGVYDLPALIDYSLKVSGEKKLFYIGHSQGTTSFFVMCTERPEYNAKIRAQFSMAPIAYMKHLTSPLLKFMSFFEGPVDLLLTFIGVHEFLPSSKFLANVGGTLCSETSVTQFLCTNSLFVLCGFNIQQMNTELLPVIMGHTPAGSSVNQFMHYAQLMKINKFRQYDHGMVKNLITYKSISPPKYELRKVTAPVALFYSHNDWLAAEVDVLKLYEELGNPIGRFIVSDKKFNHLDYMWGMDADTIVYAKIFAMMSRY